MGIETTNDPGIVAKLEAFINPDEFLEDEEMTAEDIEDLRRDDIRKSANDLLLVERAREWLLGD